MKKTIKAICVFIAAVLILSIHTTASASEDTSITLHYSPGVCDFSFYKIANISDNGKVTLTEQFDDYANSVDMLNRIAGLNADEIRKLSTTLDAIILRDDLIPKYVIATSEKGVLMHTNLDRGIYLIIGEQTRDEKYLYTPSPLLVSIPQLLNNGKWEYHITINHTKLQKEELSNGFVPYSVRKIWQDTGYHSIRPREIYVQLFQNENLYDTVKLNAENNWFYEWKKLPANFKWTVVEKDIPSDYYLVADKKQTGIILTNHYKTPPPPPGENIPQTGQLWWPVPLLFILGFAFLYLGVLSKKSKETQGKTL